MRGNQRTAPFCVLLVALLAGSAAAQTSGGSTYSIFNLGDLQTGSTTASAGRGGVESAVPSSSIINSVNPAGWQDLRFVTLQAAVNFEQYQVSDGSSKLYQNNSRLQDFAVGFPYSEKLGGAVALAIHPYSTVNYRTQVEQDVAFGDTATTMRTTYSGRGGISEAYLGTSIRPLPWLSVGGAANLYFGSITGESEVSFDNAALNTAYYQMSDRYFGVGARAGIQAQPTDDLRLGAVYETGGTLDRENTRSTRVIDNGRELLDTLSTSTGSTTVPARVTFGASLVSGRFLVAADASMQGWDASQFTTARAENRYAVGVDRLPSTSMNASGFERWTFRFGAYYKQTYYQPLGGNGIDQMGLTLGARWPITSPNPFNSNTALELSLELGRRGSTDAGLTQELFGRVSMQLSVSELWFVRSRR